MAREDGLREVVDEVRGLEDLGRVLAVYSDALVAAGATDGMRRRALLVTEELTTNVLSHAGDGSWASLRLGAMSDQATIEVSYPGPIFDPSDPKNVPEADFDDPGGQGLRLIQALSAAICYVRHTERNIVRAIVNGAP